ncbi:hypothetical protein MLP_02210 [Microlunatus phosphovorus NM-1]|uniref:Uncharacterized protein n=1 Tax=Microlunatus phosphovorus (strain ATCC 700054 / DSM 10555 / JCM 9379 / NBRC 101784 / NCIMB 13414 / VKM Ac-1990 / NM-1) TaxID=1032480 RepID=F5XHU0_MICPN|nr:hypothetical protein [Microlunatus phosphovorus]BAK33235.1 hypothetical protein MLP_02210 [Microlunatus phosphovorus NM-1]
MVEVAAGAYADEMVSRVSNDPAGRLAFLRDLYRVPAAVDQGYLPYRRAAAAFMGWQLRRGLLNPDSHSAPGSLWWRTVNDSLLRDTCEASAIAFGHPGEPRTASVVATLDFIRAPSSRSWYRAHNMTIAAAYLCNEELARREGRVERFFLNLILVRVMYAHALVSAPKLALSWLAPCGRLLGDPRLGMTGIFLSLSRILPDRYPLDDDVGRHTAAEHGLGHLLDVGMIVPRLAQLYDWSAYVLRLPRLGRLLDPVSGIPSYAWDPADAGVWRPAPSRLARLARQVLPV